MMGMNDRIIKGGMKAIFCGCPCSSRQSETASRNVAADDRRWRVGKGAHALVSQRPDISQLYQSWWGERVKEKTAT